MSPTFGRKPSQEIGYGLLSANQSRASIMGSPASNGWVYELGAMLGKQGSGTANIWLGLYATSGGNTITSRLARPASTIPATNDVNWQGNLVAKTAPPASPVMIHAAYTYALQAGASGSVVGAFGQDHSGHIMHDRNGNASPDPYSASATSPQGKMSIWVEYEANVAPNTPSGLSPAHNTLVTSTPTLGGDFRDDNEALPGFVVGTADKVKKYRFEVWNAARTSRLRDSGVLNASGAQQTARRVTWTPAALGAATYVARLTVWDQFDVPSRTAEWTFTINAGGAFTGVDVAGGGYHGHWASQTNRLLHAIPATTIIGTWSHSNGLSADRVQYRLLSSAGTVLATSAELTETVTPGNTAMRWTDEVGSAFTGGSSYYVEMRGRDTAGLWTPWVRAPLFRVNAVPAAPATLSPAANHVTSTRPELSALLSDVNDTASALTATFEIRPQGGSAVTVPSSRVRFANGRWVATPTATEMPDHAVYEWRVRATDPWGSSGDWSAWRVLTYALPPVVTITDPEDAATLTTATPTITFTTDMAIISATITVEVVATGETIHTDTWAASGTGGSRAIPPTTLRNEEPYILTVAVTSTQGLIGTSSIAVIVSYPKPAALSHLDAEPVPGPFEPDASPSQWSRIGLAWPDVDTTAAPEDEFQGYAVYRRQSGTATWETLAHLPGRFDTTFIDKLVPSGVTFEYGVGYLLEKNNLDTLESTLVTDTAGLQLANTVVTSLDADDLNLVLRYWEAREVEHVREQEVVPTWGRSPLVFMGAADYRVIQGEFVLMDDDYGTYTARDVVAAIAQASRPIVQGEVVRPRVFAYRDPRGRLMTCTLSGFTEDDVHATNRQVVHLTFTEVAADVSGGGQS